MFCVANVIDQIDQKNSGECCDWTTECVRELSYLGENRTDGSEIDYTLEIGPFNYL